MGQDFLGGVRLVETHLGETFAVPGGGHFDIAGTFSAVHEPLHTLLAVFSVVRATFVTVGERFQKCQRV
ncbi:hypothetical protein GCM10018785_30790 [Streptomyces longispororuber]|uniref:Uncharacterized protein n=1 Tax=Streptomyces longispororuber TaxID=68230 RepID=A0A919DN97_9ACTN|nr:hypothetical protein GCM10018785_30790 [Streptomyces longispororuber]